MRYPNKNLYDSECIEAKRVFRELWKEERTQAALGHAVKARRNLRKQAWIDYKTIVHSKRAAFEKLDRKEIKKLEKERSLHIGQSST